MFSEQILIIAGLLVAGYILLALEVLVIPGFGLPGILGAGCLLGGTMLSISALGTFAGSMTAFGVILSTTGMLIWLPRSRYGRGMIHQGTLRDAHSDPDNRARVPIGAVGITESDLRPAGIARFGDARESVVTDGEFIEHGTPVQVVEVEGQRIMVEVAEPRPDTSEESPQHEASPQKEEENR